MTEIVTDIPQERALLAREGLDSVAGAFACDRGESLTKPGLAGRERIRLRLTDDAGRQVEWYLKRYGPAGDAHRPSGCPCCGAAGRGPGPARQEYQNIRRVAEAGVATMRPLAVGEDADLWGQPLSYLLVEAVPGEALERRLEEFLRRHGDDGAATGRFNSALVDLAANLHAAGLVHRDLYASHIFLDETAEGPRLYLIDLARVFRPWWRRFRWRVKDLAELKYSMPERWVRAHWEGFLAAYVARIGGRARKWARAIDRRVARMRRRSRRRRERRGPEGDGRR